MSSRHQSKLRVACAVAAIIVVLALRGGLALGASDPERYDLLLTKGLARFQQQQYAEAEQFFLDALAVKPGDAEASYHLGRTQIRLHQYESAKHTFRSLIQKDPGRAHLGWGIASYYDGQFRDALASLEKAEQLLSSNGLVYFYQGLSFQKLGAYDRSVRPLTTAAKLAPDLAPEVRYLLGLAYYKQGYGEEARDQLEEVLRREPQSNLASSASDLLRVLSAGKGRRFWNISTALSGQYDNNVIVLPLGLQPPGGPTGISRKSDYRTVLQLAAEWHLLQTERSAIALTYGLYQSFHRTLHGFDVQNHSPGLVLAKRFGILEGRLQYSFDDITVGRTPFLVAHTVQPVLRVFEGRRALTEFYFRYMDKDFQDNKFPINGFRDGKNWLAGVTQYLLFAQNSGHLRFGYAYDSDRTGGGHPTTASPGTPSNADWSYAGHRLATALDLQLVPKTRFTAGIDYYRQQYDNPNSFSVTGMERRADDIYIFTGTITREIRPWLSALFQYGYTRNYSNISVFDYTRSVYSVTLVARF